MGGRIAILLALFLGCSVSYAEDSVEIPLSEVWSIGFRETKQAAHLEPEFFGRREDRQGSHFNSMIFQISRTLSREKHSDTAMRSGFAVLGEGREALEQIYAILVKGKTYQERFPQSSNVSAVFLTRQIGFMHLTKIERVGSIFTINYCREPTASNPIISPKVAIIPLGELAPGTYRVEILGYSKKPDSPKSPCELITEEGIKNQVCKSFEFEVVGDKSK
jgi:hypothetical protein